MQKKICNEYYFSVDGDTEKWYLEYLQKLINNDNTLKRKVKFNITKKAITSNAKMIPAIYKNTVAFHICDYESNEPMHVMHFENILKELKNVKKVKSNLKYMLRIY